MYTTFAIWVGLNSPSSLWCLLSLSSKRLKELFTTQHFHSLKVLICSLPHHPSVLFWWPKQIELPASVREQLSGCPVILQLLSLCACWFFKILPGKWMNYRTTLCIPLLVSSVLHVDALLTGFFFFLNKQSFLNYWNPWISLKDFFQAADFYFLRVISIWFLQMCGILAKETLCKLFHWNLHHSARSCGHLIFLVQISSPQLLRLVHPGQLHWYLFNLSALVSAILWKTGIVWRNIGRNSFFLYSFSPIYENS